MSTTIGKFRELNRRLSSSRTAWVITISALLVFILWLWSSWSSHQLWLSHMGAALDTRQEIGITIARVGNVNSRHTGVITGTVSKIRNPHGLGNLWNYCDGEENGLYTMVVYADGEPNLALAPTDITASNYVEFLREIAADDWSIGIIPAHETRLYRLNKPPMELPIGCLEPKPYSRIARKNGPVRR